jgi:hypothetical protein
MLRHIQTQKVSAIRSHPINGADFPAPAKTAAAPAASPTANETSKLVRADDD